MVSVTCDDNSVSRMRESYVRYIADRIVSSAMETLPDVHLTEVLPVWLLEGAPMLPTLAPGLRQIGDAIYMHDAPTYTGKKLYYANLDERVLLSGTPGGRCGVVTSGDLDRVNAVLEGLPLSRICAAPTLREHTPFEAHPVARPGPDAPSFDRAVSRLGDVVRQFGEGTSFAVPDLPERAKRVVESVNGSVVARNVMSLSDSEGATSQKLHEWLANEHPAGGWLGRAATADRARALLPTRTRVVLVTTDGHGQAMLITDEDHDLDDPPVLSVRPGQERIAVASPRLSATLASTSIWRIPGVAGKAATLLPREWGGDDPTRPLVDDFFELAPGVFRLGSTALFAEVAAYSKYVESLDVERLGLFAPPEGAVARKPKVSAPVMPDVLATLGFKVFDVKSRYQGAKRRGALGRMDGALVWVNHHIVTTPRAPLVYCLADDEPTVIAWLKKRAKESSPSSEKWD